MIYVKLLFHKYQLLILLPFLLSLNLFIEAKETSLLFLSKYIIFLLFYSMAIIVFRKIYKIKQFEPLKEYLESVHINSSLAKTNQTTISIIFSGLCLIVLYFWLDLSIYGGFAFFTGVLIINLFTFICFYHRIRLFDKYFNFVFLIFLVVIWQFYNFHYLFHLKFNFQILLDCIVVSSLVLAFNIFEDMRKLYVDHQVDKKTLVRMIGIEKSKKVIYGLSLLIYLPLIIMTISEYNPFYLLPLFSVPMLFNIVFRMYKLNISEYKKLKALFLIYLFYHIFLMSISNIFADKFHFL